MLKIYNFVCFTLLLIQTGVVWSGIKNSEEWEHHVALGKREKYHFYWTIHKDSILIQIEAGSKGWIGFGLSADGSLINSDVIIGGVNSKEKYFYAYHGNKNGRLNLDKQSDWRLLDAKENKSYTVLRFTRKLDTCNPDDWPITGDTQWILYALSDKDLTTHDLGFNDQRLWNNQGLRLLQPRIYTGPMPAGTLIWDMRIGNYTLPGNLNTLYYCKIFRGPQLRRKHHIIKITSIISETNAPFIHHLALRKCTVERLEDAEAAIQYGGVNCFQEGIPIQFRRCNNLFHTWGINGGTLIYPQHMGAVFGAEPDEYFMIQMHYNNPTYINDIMDNSGLRFYYTPNLRKYDAALLGTGMLFEDLNVIPPRQREFMLAGHSSNQCLRQTIPKDGIHVSIAFLHTHLLGRKLLLRHFRGSKELPPLVSDMNYDFNRQMYSYFSKEVTILPSDQLTLECTYESTDRNTTTFGGRSTSEEMCVVILFYRPPIDLGRATSSPSLETIAGLTGMDLSTGIYNVTGVMGYPDMDYRNYLQNYDWTNSHICTVQNTMRFSPQQVSCSTTHEGEYRVPRVSYPENLKRYIPPDPCEPAKQSSRRKMYETKCKDY